MGCDVEHFQRQPEKWSLLVSGSQHKASHTEILSPGEGVRAGEVGMQGLVRAAARTRSRAGLVPSHLTAGPQDPFLRAGMLGEAGEGPGPGSADWLLGCPHQHPRRPCPRLGHSLLGSQRWSGTWLHTTILTGHWSPEGGRPTHLRVCSGSAWPRPLRGDPVENVDTTTAAWLQGKHWGGFQVSLRQLPQLEGLR